MHGRVSMQKHCLMNARLVEVVAGGRRPCTGDEVHGGVCAECDHTRAQKYSATE